MSHSDTIGTSNDLPKHEQGKKTMEIWSEIYIILNENSRRYNFLSGSVSLKNILKRQAKRLLM